MKKRLVNSGKKKRFIKSVCRQNKKKFHSTLANLLHPRKICRHIVEYELRQTHFC